MEDIKSKSASDEYEIVDKLSRANLDFVLN